MCMCIYTCTCKSLTTSESDLACPDNRLALAGSEQDSAYIFGPWNTMHGILSLMYYYCYYYQH